MMNINENDWKIFKKNVPVWQEKHMEKLCAEYIRILQEDCDPSDRFWKLERRINEDKTTPGVCFDRRRSTMFGNLVALFVSGVISSKELKLFSSELREKVIYLAALEKKPDARLLVSNPSKSLYPPKAGDEVFVNGIFRFNISALLKEISNGRITPPVVDYPVDQAVASQGSLERENIDQADLSRPIILLEIAPDCQLYQVREIKLDYVARGYVVADGYHRIAKAKEYGIQFLPAYLISMNQHFPFLCSGREQYIEYWNQKIYERESDFIREFTNQCEREY